MSKPFPLTMPFDYDALSPALAQDLCGQADRIRQRIRQTTTAIIETGRDLLAAKERIEHGQFLGWIEAEVGISIRSAQNYMQAARFADAEVKYATVAHLPPAAVYRLADKNTSPAIVNAVLHRVEAGETVPDAAVKEMISADKAVRRQAIKSEQDRTHREEREQEGDDRESRERERERQRAEDIAKAEAVAVEIIEKGGAEVAQLIRKIIVNPKVNISRVGHALDRRCGS